VREAVNFGFAGPCRRMSRGWALSEQDVARLLKYLRKKRPDLDRFQE
jgi:hypothetical protein